jgi:GNAT superfamily N-acetyltransferase
MIARTEPAIKYQLRKAKLEDCPAIEELIELSARGLSAEDYSPEQIEGALKGAFGVDTDLIKDGTYYLAEADENLVGCGGWSFRKKIFGGDSRPSEDSGKLDPRSDPAKIRAFFVHPLWARKGMGKAILERCESEAGAMGFKSLELMATLPGVSFYSALGYTGSDPINYTLAAGLTIKFLPMRKAISR